MSKKTNNSKYTEDWIPVKSIQNGLILLDSNYYVTGIKVEPKNIFILDFQTQNNIIFNLRNFYNIIDYEFWLIVADRPVDINLYLSQLQLQYNDAPNQMIRKIISEDIAKAEIFSSTQVNAVDTEYYILFRDRKIEVLQKRVHTLISSLAGIGLISRQVSDEDMKFLLQNFLNGGVKNDYGTVMSNV
ncbi:MAG: hypothetical protein PHF21_03900 [Bacilli bacterium]|nr:hypothetical protein [Bacilli bacterium]